MNQYKIEFKALSCKAKEGKRLKKVCFQQENYLMKLTLSKVPEETSQRKIKV